MNQYSRVLSQAGEESESQTGRPYPFCQPAGHPGGKHQESLQPAWRWESIWTSTAFLVQFPEKMSLLKIHTSISSVQTQGIIRRGSSARREGMAQCNTGPLTFTLGSSDCVTTWIQTWPAGSYSSFCTDPHWQMLPKCKRQIFLHLTRDLHHFRKPRERFWTSVLYLNTLQSSWLGEA